MDVELIDTSGYPSPFGYRKNNTNLFWVYANGASKVQFGYGNSKPKVNATMTGRLLLSANKNVLAINGTTVVTATKSTFQSGGNLYLFGVNNNGALQYPAKMKLYSCKIYSNGSLVRDLVPCKSASGKVGLLDKLSSTFYGNAGSGMFIASADSTENESSWLLTNQLWISADFEYPASYFFVDNSGVANKCNKIAGTVDGDCLYYYSLNIGEILASDAGVWASESYRTITFTEEPTGGLLTWLQANATPQ